MCNRIRFNKKKLVGNLQRTYDVFHTQKIKKKAVTNLLSLNVIEKGDVIFSKEGVKVSINR